MIRIIDIINRIIGVHKSFIELHNSIIIRNFMNIHKSITFRKLHNSKLWSSIIRIRDLRKRLSSLAQHRMMYICIQSMPFECQSYPPPPTHTHTCTTNTLTLQPAPFIHYWKIEGNVFILLKLWRTWQVMQKNTCTVVLNNWYFPIPYAFY